MAREHTNHGAERRRSIRYGVPATVAVAVAGVAAAAFGLTPGLVGSGGTGSGLPQVTAEELLAKMAAADNRPHSGTVELTAELGLPAVAELMTGGDAGGWSGGGGSPSGEQGADGTSEPGLGGTFPADPKRHLLKLAAGSHVLRVAADGPEKRRLSIIEEAAEYSLIRNGEDVWGYDSGSNTVHHEEGERAGSGHGWLGGVESVSPQQAAAELLERTGDSTSFAVGRTVEVAGRDAYQLVIRPEGADSTTVGSVRLAVDADTGVPLRFTLLAKDGGKPALDAAFTDVDFAQPSADTFRFKPPKGAEVHAEGDEQASGGYPEVELLGEGWDSVAETELTAGAPLPAGVGREVQGRFGTGWVINSRLVNALLTEDGKVYAGAVTDEALARAAAR